MAPNILEAVRHQPWGGGFEITRGDLRTGGCPRRRGTLQLCLNCSRETPAETRTGGPVLQQERPGPTPSSPQV